MEKINVVPVAFDKESLESAIKNLKLDNVNLEAIFMDNSNEKVFSIGDKQIPINSFSNIHQQAKKYKDCVWLISSFLNDASDIGKMKKFLMTLDVAEKNIVNFDVVKQISPTWFANLQYIKEHGADFFATGNEYMQVGLNLKHIPRVHKDKADARGGVNLADSAQDLRQSYLTAKHIFEHVAPGTIKFVLIGLAPDSFRYDNAKDFSRCTKNLQYLFALNPDAENDNDRMLKNLLTDDVKNNFLATTSAQADLNLNALKAANNSNFSMKAAVDWEIETTLSGDAEEKNLQILKDYIQLCLDNGAKPVGVVFPFAPLARKNYDKELLDSFREKIHQLEESYDFTCVNMFERFNYNVFSDMTHLNLKGTLITNSLLAFRLFKRNLIPLENFCYMTYEYFHQLSYIVPKNDYNDFMECVFKASARRIRRKNKIKVAFLLYDTSVWCGDDLYNYFANDERFEVTIFNFLRVNRSSNKLIIKDFWQGVEKFKSRNLNVVPLEGIDAKVPEQDVLIFLTIYFQVFPNSLRPLNITARTLIEYIPYATGISTHANDFYNNFIFHVACKTFFQSTINLKIYKKMNRLGMPRGYYSGYPKLDIFFKKGEEFQFNWKMTRPDAKKIIWAPHHSITGINVIYSTFQWNYQFMYEFAKAHPETSWVVKPHPNLLFRAVERGVFPSIEAFNEYLQKWNDLPNAQVYTGAYYQEIFATSDGMIHDSGSFIAEYQYVDKPMIYLTRKEQKFNELGNEILKVSYLVDGKDFEGISALMQRVFIKGDDYKAAKRREVFDKYLNYPKYNKMLASKFIYKSIADEFKEEST